MNESVQERAGAVCITGCSTGIGKATALELDRRGYLVFAGVRREDDARYLAAEASERLRPLLLDITDQQAIDEAAREVASLTGSDGLLGLVNNAGISVACPLEFLPLEKLRQQFEVNLFGHLAVTQAMLPLLRRRSGRIVNISSLSGLVSGPCVGAYAASKHALESLSDSLRLELRHFGISVSVVQPADIATPIWEKSTEMADRLSEDLVDEALDRLPEEVGQAYRSDIEAMRKATASFAEHALPVSAVVGAIAHALSARRPKTRYRVGFKCVAAKYLLRNLPDRLRGRIILRNVGMR